MDAFRVHYPRHILRGLTSACGLIVWTVAAMLVWQFAFPAHAQSQKLARPLHIEKIRGDLYMLSGDGGEGDVGVEVTSDGVILGDDMFDRDHDEIIAQVKSVSDKPIKYIFNTHYHDDHSGGDARMLPLQKSFPTKISGQSWLRTSRHITKILRAPRSVCPRLRFRTRPPCILGGRKFGLIISAAATLVAIQLSISPMKRQFRQETSFSRGRAQPLKNSLFLLIMLTGAAYLNGRKPWTERWLLTSTG